MFAQAPHLTAMLVMTGERKQEACDKLTGFEAQMGAGVAEIKKCGGDFPEAFKAAKTFCGVDSEAGLRLLASKTVIEV